MLLNRRRGGGWFPPYIRTYAAAANGDASPHTVPIRRLQSYSSNTRYEDQLFAIALADGLSFPAIAI